MRRLNRQKIGQANRPRKKIPKGLFCIFLALKVFICSTWASTPLPFGSEADEFSAASLNSTNWVMAQGLHSTNVGLTYTNGRISYDWNQFRKIGRFANLTGVSLKWSKKLTNNQPWTILAKCHLDMKPGWDGGPFGQMGMPRYIRQKFFIGLDLRAGHEGFLPGFDGSLDAVLVGLDTVKFGTNSLPSGYEFNIRKNHPSAEFFSDAGGEYWIGLVYHPDQASLTAVYARGVAGAMPTSREWIPIGPIKEFPPGTLPGSFSIYLNFFNLDQDWHDFENAGRSTLKNYGSFSIDRFLSLPTALALSPSVKTQTITAKVGSLLVHQVKATEAPTNYSSTNLPVGLALNRLTGVISGTPTRAGRYELTVVLSNSVGRGSGNVEINVEKGTPAILRSPNAGGITFGQTLGSSTLTNGSAAVPESFPGPILP